MRIEDELKMKKFENAQDRAVAKHYVYGELAL